MASQINTNSISSEKSKNLLITFNSRILPGMCAWILFFVTISGIASGVSEARKLSACRPNSTTGSVSGACVCNTGNEPNVRCIGVPGMVQIPTDILPDTKTLIVEGVNIEHLLADDFAGLDSLTHLYLQKLNLKHIDQDAFRNLYNLEVLVLQNNALVNLDPTGRTFRFLTSLKSLDLSHNKLISINKHSFVSLFPLKSGTSLTVSLRENNISCGCDVYALRKWMQWLDNPFFQLVEFICQNDYDKRYYDKIPLDSFGCNDTAISEEPVTCRVCSNERTSYACNLMPTINCLPPQKCMKSVKYSPTAKPKLSIISQCQNLGYCSRQAQQNGGLCVQARQPQLVECHYCCTDSICPPVFQTDRTNDYEYRLDFISTNRQYSSQLFDSSSSFYKDWRKITMDNMQDAVKTFDGGADFYVDRVEPIDNLSYRVVMKIAVSVMGWRKESGVFTELSKLFSDGSPSTYFHEVANLSQPHTVRRIRTVKCDKEGNWPATYPGTTVHISCPGSTVFDPLKYESRTCYSETITTAKWGEINATRCKTPTTTTSTTTTTTTTKKPVTLPPVTGGDYNPVEAEKSADDILIFLSNSTSYTSEDVNTMVTMLEKVVTEANLRQGDVPDKVVKCLSGLFDGDPDLLRKAQEEEGTSTRLLHLIDELGEKVPLKNGRYKYSTKNLAVAANSFSTSNVKDFVLSERISKEDSLEIEMGNALLDSDDTVSQIVIPSRSVARSLSSTEKQKLQRVTFSVHKDSKLFESLKQPATTTVTSRVAEVNSEIDRFYTTSVNGRVISASFPGVGKIENLDQNVTMTFKHHEKNSTNPQCMYWEASRKAWVGDGCGVVTSNDDQTTCGCNHLTNFALLMDIYQEGGGPSAADKKALSIISFIGCGISLLSLLFTLFTYSLFRKLRRDTPSKILINLCVALLFTNLIFLVGMQDYAFDNIVSCKIVAALLHYFLLASLTWMAVEAFYMYLALVLVFKTYFSRFILKLALVGWGVPAVIVAITLGVDMTDNYGYLDSGICWLKLPAFYIAFVGPVLLILLMNFIAFGLVTRQLIQMSSNRLSSTDRFRTIHRLRGAVGVVILLGLTWIFAVFAIDSASVVFYYLFTLFNSLQGLFIFIFYCLCKSDATTSWKKFCSCCFDKSEFSTTSASRASTTNPGLGQRKTSSSISVDNTLSTTATITDTSKDNSLSQKPQGFEPMEKPDISSYPPVDQIRMRFENGNHTLNTHI